MGIEFTSNIPIYIQVMNDIKRKIARGDYKPCDRVESVRELALLYGANPNTIQRALQELEREGLLLSQRTTGRFITDNAELISACKKNLADEFTTEYVASVESIGLSIDDGIQLLQETKQRRVAYGEERID